MKPTLPEVQDFDSLWDFDDPAGTEAKFRALLSTAGMDGANQAELLTQIARCQGLQRHFEAAHQTLDQVLKCLPPGALRARIRYALERGRSDHHMSVRSCRATSMASSPPYP